MIRTYDPKSVTAVFGVLPLTDFVKGTFITVKQNSAKWNFTPGLGGNNTRSRIDNDSATITFSLMSNSTDNDMFYAAFLADVIGAGALPLIITEMDTLGVTFTCLEAWVEKFPDVSISEKVGSTTWTLKTDSIIPIKINT